MKAIFFSPFLILSLALLLNAPAFAAPEGISKQQAVNAAQQEHPGRVLAVKRKGAVYRVKMLSANGKVRIILVDANSGKIISGQ